jgi:hypothetical protein
VIRIRKIDRECIRARWLVFFVQFSSSFFRAGLGALDLARSSDFYFSTSALGSFRGEGENSVLMTKKKKKKKKKKYIYTHIYIYRTRTLLCVCVCLVFSMFSARSSSFHW